jgi:hypothetical protein
MPIGPFEFDGMQWLGANRTSNILPEIVALSAAHDPARRSGPDTRKEYTYVQA